LFLIMALIAHAVSEIAKTLFIIFFVIVVILLVTSLLRDEPPRSP